MKYAGLLVNARSMLCRIGLILAALCLGSSAAFSVSTTKLNWEMLIPQTEPLENFFEDVPFDQQQALRNLLYLEAYPKGDVSEEVAAAREEARNRVAVAREDLEKQGVDIDDLYERYKKWAAEVERRGTLTEPKLDGERISISGYLLPLDFDPDGTTEFLLVPYFGACIHEPPPPPNQVVYLKSSSPYAPTALFEGVTVTGTMRVQPATKDLSFVDGSSEVASAYILEGDTIELYQE
ncbi:hypothetical protein GCM10011385_22820 [Nitratireductor aestuarii]|uniref:DUF3299 domain-containing protein n=2 Tax=Nitratireductor aestuarii TaxID=1735103 RepID=A0A916W5J1_9HYPH|nr:hypothetical protein GCM10011385_22820 [Nitratireductor aestuarii]